MYNISNHEIVLEEWTPSSWSHLGFTVVVNICSGLFIDKVTRVVMAIDELMSDKCTLFT